MGSASPHSDLLQSPPFPGIDPATAAIIDVTDRIAPTPRDPVRARRVAALLAAGRVGGCFWGEQVAGRSTLIVAGAGVRIPDGDLSDTIIVSDTSLGYGARGAMVVGRDVDPWSLILRAARIITDPADIIAVLAGAVGRDVLDPYGRPVIDPDCQRLDDAVLRGRRYRDPFTGRPATAEAAIALLAFWRSTIDANRGLVAATGMARWKRREIERLLWDGRTTPLAFPAPPAAVALVAKAVRAGGDGAVAAWPSRVRADFAERAGAAGGSVRWVEDGFLRSTGLGSALHPPLSIAVDDLAPYYDPSRPSRLETILQSHPFPQNLLDRATALRARIVTERVGKYGVAGTVAGVSNLPCDRRIVLVAGQVEDDESVRRGGGEVAGNLDLLRRVRFDEPDAYIIYRPHPDVEAGHRRGAVADTAARRYVDAVIRGGSLAALIDRADAVHVLTSLTGFEALLRHRPVVVHGQPFFAGWGLTHDVGPPLARRSRHLTLDMLVAGVLIVYPRYLDPCHGLPCQPEVFITGIASSPGRSTWLTRLRRVQGRIRRMVAG